MKTTKVWLAVGITLVVLVGTGYALSRSYQPWQNRDGLTLEVQADKESYLPGEMNTLHFRIINKSNTSTSLYRGSTVWDGNLRVFIADNNGGFREYFGPSWGTKDTYYKDPIRLAPNQSFETEVTVLWNHRLDTAHLNKIYAKNVDGERIKTNYALTDPGTYYIKAILYNPLTQNVVESESIQVTVEEPQGADLEIWNKIKVDGNYGLFIQTGGLMEHPKGAKTVKVANDLENVLSQHPDSRYANSIRSSLSKRKEALDRLERDKQLENNY